MTADLKPVPEDVKSILQRIFSNSTSAQLVDLLCECREAVAHAMADSREIEREILRRMIVDGATTLMHPDFKSIKRVQKYDEDIHPAVIDAELQPLVKAGECPADLVQKAVRLDPGQPAWKTNATYLKQLQALGGKVADAVNKGWVKSPGGWALQMESRKK